MAGYYIGEIEVTDTDAYETYKPKAQAAIAAHGGEYIVRGGATHTLEGTPPAGRVVILKFPDVEAVKTWFRSDDYAEAHAIRSRAAVSRTFAVEGLDLPPAAGRGPCGYYVGERAVHDEEGYKEYLRLAVPTIDAYGGAYMIKAGRWEVLEGDAPMPRVVALRFPNVEQCEHWWASPAYRQAHAVRERTTVSRTFVAEGAS